MAKSKHIKILERLELDAKNLEINAQRLKENAAALREELSGGSGSSNFKKGLSDSQKEQLIAKRRKRILG